MALLKLNNPYVRMFFLTQAIDHISGATGLVPTVTLSKNGGAFAAAAGAITEAGYGWYAVALTTGDINTLGNLTFHCTAATADPTDFTDTVTINGRAAGLIPAANTFDLVPFLMVLVTDHDTGATGKTVSAWVSQAGAAFVPAIGAITEIGNGWYMIGLTAADVGSSAGDLALHFEAAGCDPTDIVEQLSDSLTPAGGAVYCYGQGQELHMLKQHAVLWPFSGYDRYGQPIVDFPVQICVRWLDKRREVLDPKGNTVALDATAVVDRRIQQGSWLWKGSLEDWYNGVITGNRYQVGTAPGAPAYQLGSAAFDNELMEVKTYDETPDIKARHAFRTVGMIRIPNGSGAEHFAGSSVWGFTDR